ncbi:cytochrome d ubiquinol oxidase subunit II [Rhizosaccharibacter radicis]|uniref:Cytochrome d ubiquinol oxidase subunit II n=1 Tax=Rhizosaccharibacter radicis TaxID=2782605 RepID=A0ABT1VZG2_9PROT|nr:cytochrome d ubiquinol oxidase subunit II [Acetobacteraceae bacterium KSS12]
MTEAYWLPILWAGLVAFAVLAYVVLDGFDLGLGILFPVEKGEGDRDVMVNSVAPVWDGNETWLIFGGAALYGVFPVAYSTILPALYPTIIAMLLALIFRGVAFEFRFRAHTPTGRRQWDLAFWLGSTTAALAQGLTLGGLMQGIKVQDGQYAGGWWDWLTPFTVLCGIAVVIGYGLLGACWLVWRTEGDLQRRSRRHASVLGALMLAMIVVVSLWTPQLHLHYLRHWLVWPRVLIVSPVPVLVAALAILFFWSLKRDHHLTPLLCALGWFFLSFSGLGISLWPWIVPPSIDIWQASSPPTSQIFLLVGSAVLVPTILAYTAYAYWVFRGKIGADTHYH